MPIGTEDVLVASTEIRVYLAREKSVFRNIGSTRVLVQRQHKKPRDADDDTEEREIRGDLQKSRVAAGEQRPCYNTSNVSQ